MHIGILEQSRFKNVSAPVDDNNNYLVLKLEAENYQDTSPASNAVTVNGSVPLNTSIKKNGNSSFQFTNNPGNYLSIPGNNNFNFGSGNWTIECWCYLLSLPGAYNIFASRWAVGVNGQLSWQWGIVNGQIQMAYSTTGSNYFLFFANIPTATKPLLNNWRHIASVRNGNNLISYYDGVKVGEYSMGTDTNIYQGTLNLTVGRDSGSTEGPLNGYVDSLKIHKGFAKYTKDFLPQ